MSRFFLGLILLTSAANAQSVGDDVFKKNRPIPNVFSPLPFASIKPKGWLLEQLRQNLNGFTGHLDSLAPDLMIKDDIYGKDRLSRSVTGKNVGALGEAGDWQVQFLWWNSESQSNWWDGYVRTVILANDEAHLIKIKSYVDRIIGGQDRDGYLGIYDPELRYHFTNENGELWAKATLLRGLLAWYAYSKDKKVLNAIERAVENTMANYPASKSDPFYSKKPDVGGLSHGLVLTDVLEQLYAITKRETYRDYVIFLYKSFSGAILNEDAQYAKLNDPAIALKGHGVHTYEHLRPVTAAYYATGNPKLKNTLDRFLKKIEYTTLPSGAPAGDEWILGRSADATSTGYEYCSIHELMDSYASLFSKTGEARFGDLCERIFFNAAQGARQPDGNGICYLKTDNSYALTGGKNGDTTDRKQTRYRYSPVHKEAAVCCVPNAGRIGAYFVQNMWMQTQETIIATLLGPCEITASIGGKEITIQEQTQYPFQNSFMFTVHAEAPAKFDLKIRKPAWATIGKCSLPFEMSGEYITFSRTWSGSTSFTLSFGADVVKNELSPGEYYFQFGALVLAHPIEAQEKITRKYTIAALRESEYRPLDPTIYKAKNNVTVTRKGESLTFDATMFNPKKGTDETIVLSPMGQTILRQVTFKK